MCSLKCKQWSSQISWRWKEPSSRPWCEFGALWSPLAMPKRNTAQLISDFQDGGTCTRSGFSLSWQNSVLVFFVSAILCVAVLFVLLFVNAHIQPWVSARRRQNHIHRVKPCTRRRATLRSSAPDAHTITDPQPCISPTVEAPQAAWEEAEEGVSAEASGLA